MKFHIKLVLLAKRICAFNKIFPIVRDVDGSTWVEFEVFFNPMDLLKLRKFEFQPHGLRNLQPNQTHDNSKNQLYPIGSG